MCTVYVLLCFVLVEGWLVVVVWLISAIQERLLNLISHSLHHWCYPYPSGLLHMIASSLHKIAPVPVKQPLRIWANTSHKSIITHCGLVMPYSEIWVNIGSGNGLLPDGTKPLPEPMLTDHQWSPVTFILGQFHKRCLNHQSLKSVWKLRLKFHSNFPGANELKSCYYTHNKQNTTKHVHIVWGIQYMHCFFVFFCIYIRLAAFTTAWHYWQNYCDPIWCGVISCCILYCSWWEVSVGR